MVSGETEERRATPVMIRQPLYLRVKELKRSSGRWATINQFVNEAVEEKLQREEGGRPKQDPAPIRVTPRLRLDLDLRTFMFYVGLTSLVFSIVAVSVAVLLSLIGVV